MDFKDKNSQLFLQLVFMYHAACMEQLGKVKSTITGKIERDLGAAQSTIDLLDMLKEKTKGNLSQEEDRFLTELIRELKLNFVDEKLKDEKAKQKQPKEEAPKQEETGTSQ
ncbi:MAG: DUF1844 domain-containing protein [Bacteroidetes bacterium]|nr:DUF1844 domain-containing protein [Bacteroidota bacterium]MCW5897099.1 DUF1844 domain-containing protein [Bacteroidota bacterium]